MKFPWSSMTGFFVTCLLQVRGGGLSSTLRIRLMGRFHVVAAISRTCGLFRYFGREIELWSFFLPAIKYFRIALRCATWIHNSLSEVHLQGHKEVERSPWYGWAIGISTTVLLPVFLCLCYYLYFCLTNENIFLI